MVAERWDIRVKKMHCIEYVKLMAWFDKLEMSGSGL